MNYAAHISTLRSHNCIIPRINSRLTHNYLFTPINPINYAIPRSRFTFLQYSHPNNQINTQIYNNSFDFIFMQSYNVLYKLKQDGDDGMIKLPLSALNIEEKIEKSLKGRDFLTLLDFTTEEITYLLHKAYVMKQEATKGNLPPALAGKTLGMIFEKHSTRTRISFEVGMIQLGGHAMFMNAKDLQIGRGESVYDTGHVLSEYLDGVMIRANSHEMVKELAKHTSVPVINGLTDLFHPCQAMADLLTMIECKGAIAGLKLAYVGDGNNVAHSLIIGAAHMGMHVAVATPAGYECNGEIVVKAKELASHNGGSIVETNDPIEAVIDADIVYTDVWTSMGQEDETEKRLQDFAGFQINDELIVHAKSDFVFLHCLPAHREEEVSASVIDGPNSFVFQQAGNRLHAQKAILAAVIE